MGIGLGWALKRERITTFREFLVHRGTRTYLKCKTRQLFTAWRVYGILKSINYALIMPPVSSVLALPCFDHRENFGF